MANNNSHTGAPGNPVNEALSKAVRNFSNFKLRRRRHQTMHFGLIEPHMVIEGVSTDVLPLQSMHNLRSYTLSNVLMSDVKMHKEYFSVNRDAILPKNWQKVFENPTFGDDVLSDVNSYISYSDLRTELQRVVNRLISFAEGTLQAFPFSQLPGLLRDLFFLESFVGNGCLLHTLGIGLGGFFEDNMYLPAYFRDNEANVIDYIIDVICGYLVRFNCKLELFEVESGSLERTYYVFSAATHSHGSIITWRDAFMIMRECPYFNLYYEYFDDGEWHSDIDFDIKDIWTVATEPGFTIYDVLSSLALSSVPSTEGLNIARLVAYQLVCAHYFTNDHVDYVYTSELFEQVETSLYQQVLTFMADGKMHSFSYNGIDCFYDTFSGHVLKYILNVFCGAEDITFDDGTAAAAAFLFNLFSFRRSLRYRDYFIGAKPTPLALGDTNVAVNNNLVSIIDTTKGIASQRFLNQVNRIGRRIESYLKGLYPGAKVEKDIHEPTWLARTDHDVKAVENENTAAAQYELESSITSVFRSSDNRYIFECEVGRPSIIIGVTYFDVPRSYAYSVDKNAMEEDRFDMFIPQLQFIGDQPIMLSELGRFSSEVIRNNVFAYTLRDMQYKQLFDISIGGFVDKLPGWCFLAPRAGDDTHISPDVIRSRPSELDRFYLSLTGYSLGSYFHFILLIDNFIDAKRPMVYAPSIL